MKLCKVLCFPRRSRASMVPNIPTGTEENFRKSFSRRNVLRLFLVHQQPPLQKPRNAKPTTRSRGKQSLRRKQTERKASIVDSSPSALSARPTHLASWCSWWSGKTPTKPISFRQSKPTSNVPKLSFSSTRSAWPGIPTRPRRTKARTNGEDKRVSWRARSEVGRLQST